MKAFTIAFNTRLFGKPTFKSIPLVNSGASYPEYAGAICLEATCFFVYQEDRNFENWSHLDRRLALKATYWWDN